MRTSTDEVLSLPPRQLLEWVRLTDPVPDDISLEAVAFGAHRLALNEGPRVVEERLVYAQVAVAVWLRCAGSGIDGVHESVLSEILLRSELLRRFDVESDPVFGEQPFLHLLERSIGANDSSSTREWMSSPQEVLKTDRSTLLLLRRIKNIVRSANLYLDVRDNHLGPIASWWWERRELLP